MSNLRNLSVRVSPRLSFGVDDYASRQGVGPGEAVRRQVATSLDSADDNAHRELLTRVDDLVAGLDETGRQLNNVAAAWSGQMNLDRDQLTRLAYELREHQQECQQVIEAVRQAVFGEGRE